MASPKRKTMVRVFLDEWVLGQVDALLGKYGSSRSEVIRTLLVKLFSSEEAEG
jgi:metal-responsive CopG/Arc/MetJ family transcriptional regulator